MVAAALAFALAFTTGAVALGSTPLGGSLPTAQAHPQSAKTSSGSSSSSESSDSKGDSGEAKLGAAQRWIGGYEDVAGRAGSTIQVDGPLFDDKTTTDTVEKAQAPKETKFLKAGNTLPEGASLEVHLRTGAITISTSRHAAPGTYTVDVKFCFRDGTKRTETVNVTIEPADSARFAVEYGAGQGEIGGTIKIPAPVFRDQTKDGKPEVATPHGTKFVERSQTLPDEATVEVDPETGELTITTLPETEPGNYAVDVQVRYPDGSTGQADVAVALLEPTPRVDREKCVESVVNYGLPLLALIPLGLATQINIPGLKTLVDEIDAWYIANNYRLQTEAGIFDREAADYALRFNAKLREVAPYAADAAIGVTMVAMGLVAVTMIYDSCTPDGPLKATSSIQGSSGAAVGPDGLGSSDAPTEAGAQL